MKVVAIIPARGGSKSIPKKNIYPILGKPLIAYTIESALQSKLIDRVIVSTDDKEIAKIAKKYGAEVPFVRPKNLAGDKTPDLPVFQHAITWLKENEKYEPDLVVQLWATSPVRLPKDIDKAIKQIQKKSHADSLRSITTPSQTPFKMWRSDKSGYLKPILEKEYAPHFRKKIKPYELPRQSLPKTFIQTGYISIIRPKIITEQNSMFGKNILLFFHDPNLYTEFDSLKDLFHCEFVIKEILYKKK